MTTEVDFWVDPGCPWCWVTARWVLDEVAPQRELQVNFRAISLFFKNDPAPESEYYERSFQGHKMLRVLENLRINEGAEAVQKWYLYCGAKIHSDGDRFFDFAEGLTHLGLDPAYAEAADDEKWDVAVRESLDAALELVGNDVGTPIIAFTAADGVKRGIFGPVITRVPTTPEQSLRVWDAMEALTTMDGFWELKRTRTERPEIPARPSI